MMTTLAWVVFFLFCLGAAVIVWPRRSGAGHARGIGRKNREVTVTRVKNQFDPRGPAGDPGSDGSGGGSGE